MKYYVLLNLSSLYYGIRKEYFYSEEYISTHKKKINI